jgi:hypothetical protein
LIGLSCDVRRALPTIQKFGERHERRPLRFSVDDLEKFLRVTGDMTPIYWLIEQFLEDADVRQRRALAELSKMMPQLAALLKQAGGT